MRVWTTTCYFLLATAKLYSYNYLLLLLLLLEEREEEMLIVALDSSSSSSSSFWLLLYKIEMKKKDEEEEEEFLVCPLRASWWEPRFPLSLKDTLNIDPGLSAIDAFYADQSEWRNNSWPAQLVPSSLARDLWLYTNHRTSKQQQELSGSTSAGNRRPAESVWRVRRSWE